jgi:outer membrane protein assembly factor BamE
MHKLLISLAISASFLTSGCSTFESLPEYASNLPLMYRPTIQQGNVVDQDMVNRLKPGMSKRQVRYILGTPGIIDNFHQNRWDYIYTIKENGKEMEQKEIAVYFDDDRLVRIEGDFRPLPVDEMAMADKKETVVDVPDYEAEKKGFVTKTLETIGIVPKEE